VPARSVAEAIDGAVFDLALRTSQRQGLNSMAEPARRGDLRGSSIAPVIERLAELDRELKRSDGVRRFNDLYLATTRAIESQVAKGGFEDPGFLTALDLAFAGRYFAAVDAAAHRGAPSPAWAPLFADRFKPRIAPIQFALAGMNAHVNFDLCEALVATCAARKVELASDSAQHRDYLKVNAILARVEEETKRRFRSELIHVADEVLGRLDDVLAMWSLDRARDAAWTHAEILWELRRSSFLEDRYVDTLGHIVGLAGRGLLVATL